MYKTVHKTAIDQEKGDVQTNWQKTNQKARKEGRDEKKKEITLYLGRRHNTRTVFL